MVVTLDHGGHHAKASASGGVQMPNLVAHRVIMGVNDVRGIAAVAC